MRKLVILLLCVLATPLMAATTANDDSCDIAVQPAATLLLPYFEVDFASPPSSAATTLFTIQNVSRQPQIVNVTLWTDRGYPGLTFPMFLSGYDVQAINLYDLFASGTIASAGASPGTPVPTNPTSGSQPAANDGNPNFLSGATAACASLPGTLSASALLDLKLLFAVGTSVVTPLSCPNQGNTQGVVGNQHPYAAGYITFDVVASCTAGKPTSAGYFSTLLFDNVLTGDYQFVVPRGTKSYAQGGPLVHIRAVPEGGAAGSLPGTPLPYTFYDHYTPAAQKKIDRRQPLPSLFAPRFIQGGPGGFNTKLKIWREGFVTSDASCNTYRSNSAIPFAEAVRFDEHENAMVQESPPPIGEFPAFLPTTPATGQVETSSGLLPPLASSGDVGGWIYLNLNSSAAGARPSQNWVITSMFAEPTYAVEATAMALGNGCSPAKANNTQIGPP
jgi:hypothetical protein